MNEATAPRPISAIARDIRKAWPKPYFGAVPYLNAMLQIESANDAFYEEDGRTQIIYFLGNATSFRGPEAKALKAELKAAAGIK